MSADHLERIAKALHKHEVACGLLTEYEFDWEALSPEVHRLYIAAVRVVLEAGRPSKCEEAVRLLLSFWHEMRSKSLARGLGETSSDVLRDLQQVLRAVEDEVLGC